MRTTEVSPKRFALLSAVMSQPRGPVEVQELLNWSTCRKDFEAVKNALVRLDLLKIRPIAGGRVLLEITAAGRQAWKESADLYLHLIELAKAPAGPVEIPPAVKPPPSKKRDRRLPDPEEFQAIRMAAKPYQLRTWDVVRSSLLTLDVLFALNVPDVDLRNASITIRHARRRPETLVIDAAMKFALSAAIAGRSEGPALCGHDGSRWTRDRWQHCWQRMRKRAGVADCVIPRPHPTCTGEGPQGRPTHRPRVLVSSSPTGGRTKR